MGLGGEIAGAFRWAFAAAQDAAGSALNWIIGRVQAVIGKLSEFAAKIPGAKELGADLQKTLEGWKFEGGNVAAATEGIRSERLERVEIFERAQKNISNAMDRSTTNITNNVTVPPGTPASLARRTADATGKATKSSTKRATQAATTNRAP